MMVVLGVMPVMRRWHACQQAADVISPRPIPTPNAARVDLALPTKKVVWTQNGVRECPELLV